MAAQPVKPNSTPAKKQIKQYGGQPTTSLADGGPATALQVTQFHTNADTDVRAESIHHTLGINPFQASPGDHSHDGGSSALLLAGVTITGSRGANAALLSAIQALVKLGATDSSTA